MTAHNSMYLTISELGWCFVPIPVFTQADMIQLHIINEIPHRQTTDTDEDGQNDTFWWYKLTMQQNQLPLGTAGS